MKKLLFSLFFVFISVVQDSFAQCDYNFDFINTGSNMTVFFTPTVASAMAAEMGEGTVGAFFLTDADVYFCAASGEITGISAQLAAMGDDATTPEQDGFNANQEMLWFYESTDGTVYSLALSPADSYTTNAMSFITSYTSTVVDCGSSDISGCIDMTACNYNELATTDDASCTYADANLDCEGVCINDSDSDGICDENEISDSSCDYNFDFINTGSNMTVFFTPTAASAMAAEMGEGTVGAFFLTDNDVYFCAASGEITGISAQLAVMGDDATTPEQDGFNANQEILWFYESNNGPVYSLALSPADNYTTNAMSFITSYTSTVVDCGSSDVSGCTDMTACNYNELATTDDASCTYADANLDCNGVCINDSDSDGICDENEVLGCTDMDACNYNEFATDSDACIYAETNLDCDSNCLNDSDSDGICDENEISGCTDVSACNYNSNATDQDIECILVVNSCDVCSEQTDGSGVLIDNDADNDGVCNEDEEGACTDNTACNYNDDVNSISDNTLCLFPVNCDSCSGETDGTGTVIDNDTDIDGICDSDEIYGCTDDDACNYHSLATEEDNSCTYAELNLDCDGICLNDTDNDGVCNENEIVGCMYDLACNYDDSATDEGDECMFPVLYYSCEGDCSNDEDNDSVCDENEIAGCTDEMAINYNDLATDDDGSCEYETVECILPNSFVVNTGTNMTLMLTPAFITSLNVEDVGAYIVALTDEGLVIGSTLVHEDELAGGQVAMALWGDDATTENIIDGAISGENINIQLVDGGSLYLIVLINTISFTANGILALESPVSPMFSCSGDIASIMGCTNEIACNYNANATEDDDSCVFEEEGYNCNGICNFDTDNDGICDVNEILGCTDETATNYNDLATDDDGLCEYPEPVEGCTDFEANNYNELANIEDGSCLYGIGGCTYPEASNYNIEATYEDESCTFDTPFIYVSNPIDGALITTPTVSFNYEVVNTIISTDSLAGHVKYSVDGGAYGSTFDQSGEISQDFDFGVHTIQFILYDNVSGNSQPLNPLVETTINFSVGLEGCMNPLAGNYNLNAIIDNGNCIPNADVEFDNTNTGSNHTLMILMSQIGSINVDGLLSQPGDLLGVFYENNGVYYGAGYDTIVDGNIQIAAWGDDSTTDEQDGFTEGQSFVWAIQYAETGNSVYLEAIYGSGPSSYSTNEVSSIIGFEVVEFIDIEGCMDSDYVEYNPFAVINDNSCLTLKVFGCTDSAYLEYWAYNQDSLTIQLPEVISNTNDGSCLNAIEDGCTDLAYLEYCSDCNVTNNTLCSIIAIPGCTDPLALNFDTLANSDNATCEYDICINIEVANFEVITSSSLNSPVLAYDIINSGNEEVTVPMLTLNLDTDVYFEISTSIITTVQINPGDTVHIEGIITNDISTLPSYVVLSGFVHLQGQSFNTDSVNCDLAFTEQFVSTLHVGCSVSSAYNYNPLATVNDGSCIDFVQASISIFNPDCSDSYGSASVFVIGGVTPYSSPSTYTSYSDLGIPQVVNVQIDANGTINMTGLAAGVHSIEIHDSSDIIEIYEFTVISPIEVLVEANINSNNLLTSDVLQGNTVLYQWLLDGQAIEGATSSIHYAAVVGEYQVYVENENGCGAYSDLVYLNTLGITDLNEKSFNFYPNPVSSSATLHMSQLKSVANVLITDVLGQSIFNFDVDTRETSDEFSMDLSELPNGMYFIVVESNSNKIVKRFVKK